MKRLFFAVAIAAIPYAINAQDSAYSSTDASAYATKNASSNKNFIWSIIIEPSIPVGHFHSYSSFGFGGSLQGEYKPGSVGITVNAGYIDYFGKTAYNITYADFKYWPVLAGLKYYMSGKTYLQAQAGPGFGEKGLGTSFWYGGAVGCGLGKAVDAAIKYTGWKQSTIKNNGTTGGYTGGTTGGTTGDTGSGGGYGGHYSTISLGLGYKF